MKELSKIAFDKGITILKKYWTDLDIQDMGCGEYYITSEIYYTLKAIIPYYKAVLPSFGWELDEAFERKKKVKLFDKIELTTA